MDRRTKEPPVAERQLRQSPRALVVGFVQRARSPMLTQRYSRHDVAAAPAEAAAADATCAAHSATPLSRTR
jgi:hypothetical protein